MRQHGANYKDLMRVRYAQLHGQVEVIIISKVCANGYDITLYRSHLHELFGLNIFFLLRKSRCRGGWSSTIHRLYGRDYP